MFRPAAPSDLDAIAQIYEEILAAEDARPVSYTNWQRGKYPTRDTARRALEAGELWVAEEEGVLSGCVILNGAQLPEYAHIPGPSPPPPGRLALSTPWSSGPASLAVAGPGPLSPSVRRSSAARGKP